MNRKERGALVGLRRIILDTWLGSRSIMLDAVVHVWVLAFSSSSFICTSHFLPVATNTIPSDVSGITFCIVTHMRRRTGSSFEVISCCTFSSFSSYTSSTSLIKNIGTGWDLYGNIFRSGGKMPFKKPSMNEIPSRTGTADLRSPPKTTLALKEPLFTCNVIRPTMLILWRVTFFEESRTYACISLSHPARKKSSMMEFRIFTCVEDAFFGVHILRHGPDRN